MQIVGRPGILHACTLFTGTWLEAVPFLLLGILFSSIVQVFVPDGFLQKVFPRNPVLGIGFGILGGFFMPVCDCASVPVFRSLTKKGIPLPAAVAFLTAAPIINPVVMLSTWYAYGGNIRIVFARTFLGMICSVLTAATFTGRKAADFITAADSAESCGECGYCSGTSFSGKCAAVLSYSREEFIEAGSWQTIGIAIATLFQVLSGSISSSFHRVSFFSGNCGVIFSVLVMMILAYCLSLCSTSDAVICSVIGKSFAPSAQLAFLVFGPMMDIKNTILLGGMCSPKMAGRMAGTTFCVCLFVMAAFALCCTGVKIL